MLILNRDIGNDTKPLQSSSLPQNPFTKDPYFILPVQRQAKENFFSLSIMLQLQTYVTYPNRHMLPTRMASAVIGPQQPSSKYSCKYCSFSHNIRRSVSWSCRFSPRTTQHRPVYHILQTEL